MNLLAVDVGNTATSVGVFRIEPGVSLPRPLSVYTCATTDLFRPKFFSNNLKKRLKAGGFSQIQSGLVSSVVPPADAVLKRGLRRIFSFAFPFVSAKTSHRIKIHYKIPSEVGADRIVNARAALEIGHSPSIVIDFGTATTFDCVTAKGDYLGGVIAPGPLISAEALYQKTARLPRVLLEKPACILGRNTLESIQAGLYHGYRGLVKEIVTQLKKRLGLHTQVLATGGQARWILKGLPVVDQYLPHLTLQGLYHMWMDSF